MGDPKRITKKKVTRENCMTLVEEAHSFSHFAPTGKNPESSRGHVAFVIVVRKQVKYSTQESYFICVDLAGSEGETSLGGDFKKKASAATLTARRLEAGCINTGLSQLQVIFGELASKGKLNASQGNGLRRILHPFINSQTYLSVIFCLSPSRVNNSSTIATLKFANRACKIKTKPVKAVKKQTLKQLKLILTEREEQIEELHADLQDLERDLDISTENFHSVKDQLNILFAKVRLSNKESFSRSGLEKLFEKVASEFLDSEFEIENIEDFANDSAMESSRSPGAGVHSSRPSSIFFELEKKRASVALELVTDLEKDQGELPAPQSMIATDEKVFLETEEAENLLADAENCIRDAELVEAVVDEEISNRVSTSEKYNAILHSKDLNLDDDLAGLENDELTKEQLLRKVADLELALEHEKQMAKQIQTTHTAQLTYVTKKRKERNWYTFFPE